MDCVLEKIPLKSWYWRRVNGSPISTLEERTMESTGGGVILDEQDGIYGWAVGKIASSNPFGLGCLLFGVCIFGGQNLIFEGEMQHRRMRFTLE